MQGADIIRSLNNWVWTPPQLFEDPPYDKQRFSLRSQIAA